MVEEIEEEEEEEVYKGPSLPPPPPPSVSIQSLVGKKNNGGQKSALPVVAAKDHNKLGVRRSMNVSRNRDPLPQVHNKPST